LLNKHRFLQEKRAAGRGYAMAAHAGMRKRGARVCLAPIDLHSLLG